MHRNERKPTFAPRSTIRTAFRYRRRKTPVRHRRSLSRTKISWATSQSDSFHRQGHPEERIILGCSIFQQANRITLPSYGNRT